MCVNMESKCLRNKLPLCCFLRYTPVVQVLHQVGLNVICISLSFTNEDGEYCCIIHAYLPSSNIGNINKVEEMKRLNISGFFMGK